MTKDSQTGNGGGAGPAPQDGRVQVAAVALLGGLAYLLLHPILPALLWGGLLATVTAHSYERIVSRTGGNRGAAVLIVGILYLLILVGPMLFVVLEVIGHAPRLADLARTLPSVASLAAPDAAAAGPGAGTGLPGWLSGLGDRFAERLSQLLPHLSGIGIWLAARMGDLGSFLFEFTLGCVIALSLLYNRFAVRAVAARILARVGGSFAQDLMQQTFDSTRAAFRGVIVAALAQAVLTAAALVAAGIPAALMLGALTFVLALVQIGPIPAAAFAAGYLIFNGAWLAAVLILLWFLVVVMSVDNLIRPYFASRANDTPAILAFLGALGGLLAFGLIGVFVGPVLISLLHRLLLAWAGEGALTPP
jgi:predicted PurR-regulated permease PerM